MYASVDIPARSRSGGRRTLSFAAIVTAYRPSPRCLLSTMSKNAERNPNLLLLFPLFLNSQFTIPNS